MPVRHGNGWIPVDFTSLSFDSPFAVLPIDPKNTVTDGLYYTYVTGGSWKLSAMLESEKFAPQMASDEGDLSSLYEVGNSQSLGNTQRGLVGYWKFDETSGSTAYDSSGNDNDGTNNNSTTINQTGQVNKAYNFDGIDDYINIPSDDTLSFASNSFSILAWIKTDNADPTTYNGWIIDTKQAGTVLSGYDMYLFKDKAVVRVSAGSGGMTKSSTTEVTDNNWHHLAGVVDRDSSLLRIYIDGEDEGSPTSISSGDYSNTYNPKIGRHNGDGYRFNGYLDDVQIYNRALSANEIKAIYNATK